LAFKASDISLEGGYLVFEGAAGNAIAELGNLAFEVFESLVDLWVGHNVGDGCK